MHRGIGKEIAVFSRKLGGERLVVGDNERRLLDLLDHVGDGEGLTRSGHAKQRLIALTGLDALHEGFNCLGLITRRNVGRFDMQRHPATLANYTPSRMRHGE